MKCSARTLASPANLICVVFIAAFFTIYEISRELGRLRTWCDHVSPSSTSEGVSSSSHSHVCSPRSCAFPLSDVALHIPAITLAGQVVSPPHLLVATNFYGKCQFGEGEKICNDFKSGIIGDLHVLQAAATSLHGQCSTTTLVVDVGANIGQFSNFFLAMGCRVFAIEPQRPMQNMIISSAIVNGFSDRLVLFRGALASQEGSMNITAPWSPGGRHLNPLKAKYISTKTFTLTQVISSHVRFLKIDVDGPEALILPALGDCIRQYEIDNIMAELSVSLWHTFGIPRDKMAEILLHVFDGRYSIYLTASSEFPLYSPDVLRKLTFLEEFHFFTKIYYVPRRFLEEVLKMNNYSTKNLFFTKVYTPPANV